MKDMTKTVQMHLSLLDVFKCVDDERTFPLSPCVNGIERTTAAMI